LVSIERRIALLQALAESYKAARAGGALGGQPGDEAPALFSFNGVTQPQTAGFDLPTGAFLGKTMPAAIKLFLAATRKKQPPKEVAAALKEGGFESTSQNFERTVTTTMHRMKEQGELLQFKDGWGLAEHYPESLRTRLAQSKDGKARKKPAGKSVGKKVRRSPQRKGVVKKTDGARKQPQNKTAIVLRTLAAHTGVTPDEIHKTLKLNGVDCPMNYVFNVLSRLRQNGKVEKREDGRWYLTHTAAA
jgi:hypothetical protein